MEKNSNNNRLFLENLKKDNHVITLTDLLMSHLIVKRFILPFSNQQNLGDELETAAIFTIAGQNRNKNSGLFTKQTPEKLSFIAKLGYPLYFFPQPDTIILFDGLNSSDYNISYLELSPAKGFIDKLSANQRPRGKLIDFLSEYMNYFRQPPKEKSITIPGLIVNEDFKEEFNVYHKQAIELATDENLLTSELDQKDFSTYLEKFDKIFFSLKEEIEILSECKEQIKNIISQHITEIEYETLSYSEEIDAKIKAQQEFINPQITKLNKEYKEKIKDLTQKYDRKIEKLEKQKAKNTKTIKIDEEIIRDYELKAKKQSQKGHKIHERRWKEKIKRKQKELSTLKKEQKNIEKEIRKITTEKENQLYAEKLEFETRIKTASQPLVELEALKNSKIKVFGEEKNVVKTIHEPIIEDVDKCINLLEEGVEKFFSIGITGIQSITPVTYYIPFYAIGYESGSNRRIICVPPGEVNTINFSTKFKSSLGLSISKDLLNPRFKALSTLIERIEVLARQKSNFESQLYNLAKKNNLLTKDIFQLKIEKGLIQLNCKGWLSEDEVSELKSQLINKKHNG